MSHWKEIPTAITESEMRYLQHVAGQAKGPLWIEIGSQFGASTVALGLVARPKGYRLLAIDHHRGDPFAGAVGSLNEFLGNIERFCLEGVVVPVVADYRIAMETIAMMEPVGENFGLFFIDACHDYYDVADQIRRCGQLNPNGVFLFHDYGRFDGVTKAVDQLIAVEGVLGTMAVGRLAAS